MKFSDEQEVIDGIKKLINDSDHIARRYGFKNAQSISDFQDFIKNLRR